MSQQFPAPDQDTDPFLASLDADAKSFFEQTPLEETNFFAASEQGPLYDPTNAGYTDIFDQLVQFNLDSPFTTTAPSNNNTTSNIPDLSFNGLPFHSGSHTSTTYPSTPAPGTPHPYPIQLQQPQQHSSYNQNSGFTTRPPGLTRSVTNNTHLRPQNLHLPSGNRANQSFHRRSLSQGDAERIAAHLRQQQNTALPSRRAISATPEDNGRRNTTRLNPYTKATKHNQGGNRSRRSNPPTSVPTSVPPNPHIPSHIPSHNPSFSRGATSIGTPLPPSGGPEVTTQNGIRVQLTGPRFKYMSHDEQVGKSARVIEIGAMAVVAKNAGQQVPGHGGEKKGADVLLLVDQMETQLKLRDVGDKVKGLRGCEMIREALGDVEGGGEGGGDTTQDETDDGDAKPHISRVAADETPLGGAMSGNDDLFTLLKNDLEAHGFGTDEH